MKLNPLATVRPHHGTPAVITPGSRICADQPVWYFPKELPACLENAPYLDSRWRDVTSAVVTQPGWAYLLTPAEGLPKSRQKRLEEAGYAVFERIVADGTGINPTRELVLMGKEVAVGERIRGESWCTLIALIAPDYVPVQLSAASLEAPDLLFDPKDPEYARHNQAWQGIPSIGRASNGRLWATWYGGSTDENEYNWCVLYTSDDDGVNWQGPKLVVKHPRDYVRTFDPNLWTDPQGRLWFIWNQSYFHFDGRCGVWAMYTENPDAQKPTWSTPKRLADGIVMCDPVVLRGGDWLLPTAIWGWGSCEEMVHQRHSNAYISHDRGESWQYLGSVQSYEGDYSCDENMIIQHSDGSLRMLIRTTLGIEESFSADGIHWTPSKDAHLTQVVSRFYITRLPSGRQLLIYNAPPQGGNVRSHMTAALSEDDGKTWPYQLVLDEREKTSYPDACLAEDGSIYVIYDRDRYDQQQILMAKFREEDILAGQPISADTRLQVLIDEK